MNEPTTTNHQLVPTTRAGTTTVFLARHGRTALNAAGLLRGHEDVPLDEVGRAEAARLGDAFAAVGLARVVTSPLQRAVSTGQAIARRHGLSVETDNGLMDRDYGIGTGRARAELLAEFGGLDAVPGAEPLDVFAARVRAAFERLATPLGAAPTLLVAHDAVNAVLVGGDAEQHTGCWNQFDWYGERWQPVVVNEVPS